MNLSITGSPDGTEVITVNPSSATSIYDINSNAMAINQSNNTATLYDKTPAIINSTVVSTTNNSVAVTFNEPVYNSGVLTALEVSDFTLST